MVHLCAGFISHLEMSFQTVDTASAENPPQNCKSVLGAVGEVDGFALIRGRRQLLAPTYQLGALVESGTCFGAGESFSTPSRMRSAPVLAPNASPINLPSMASSGAVIDEWADIDDEIASDVASGSSPTVSALKWRLIAADGV